MRRCPECGRRWPTDLERAARRYTVMHGGIAALGFFLGIWITWLALSLSSTP